MAVIRIEIDIKNPKEVIEQQKGKLTEFLAGFFMDNKKIKKEVEAAVCKEIIKMLQPKVMKGLSEKGIQATVNYSVGHKS